MLVFTHLQEARSRRPAGDCVTGRIGPDRLPTNDIAREVGVTQAAAFRHFPTKSALCSAVGEIIAARLRARWSEAFATSTRPESRLRALMAAQLRQMETCPACHPAFTRVERGQPDPGRDVWCLVDAVSDAPRRVPSGNDRRVGSSARSRSTGRGGAADIACAGHRDAVETLVSGGRALTGAVEMGAVVPFVLWFNTFTGLVHVAGGVLLWRGHRLALPVALATLITTRAVPAAIDLTICPPSPRTGLP